jgi:crotonobetainyl-CoA:carnitine CoA-transferase CaiB-like acyl-CoA transferase
VPFGPINNIQQTFKHPQAVARGVVVEVHVNITVRFYHIFSFLPSAPARWKDQIAGSGGHLQREEDASE